MAVCIVDNEGHILVERNIRCEPTEFLDAIAPFREDLVVGAECVEESVFRRCPSTRRTGCGRHAGGAGLSIDSGGASSELGRHGVRDLPRPSFFRKVVAAVASCLGTSTW